MLKGAGRMLVSSLRYSDISYQSLTSRCRILSWCVHRHLARKNPSKGKSQRVLDIKPGSLCFVIGTIYMEMRLKPNILEELSREVRLA